jgi:histidine triad (HIT) family protein
MAEPMTPERFASIEARYGIGRSNLTAGTKQELMIVVHELIAEVRRQRKTTCSAPVEPAVASPTAPEETALARVRAWLDVTAPAERDPFCETAIVRAGLNAGDAPLYRADVRSLVEQLAAADERADAIRKQWRIENGLLRDRAVGAETERDEWKARAGAAAVLAAEAQLTAAVGSGSGDPSRMCGDTAKLLLGGVRIHCALPAGHGEHISGGMRWTSGEVRDWMSIGPDGPAAEPDAGDEAFAAGDCAFCDIVSGVGPATIVREWPDAVAFLPIGPVIPDGGHILVVPRRHVADAVEDPAVTAAVMARAAELAAGHEASNILTSVGAAATQSVFHLHLHVIRRAAGDRLMVPWGTTGDPHAPHSCRRSAAAEDENERLRAQLASIGEPVTERGILWPSGKTEEWCGFSALDVMATAADDGGQYVERTAYRGPWLAAGGRIEAVVHAQEEPQ